jgi:hypothetical protein
MKDERSGETVTEQVTDKVTDDDRCRVAGAIVERAYPGVDLALTADARARLQEAWVGQGRPRVRRRRWLVASAVGALAVLAMGLHQLSLIKKKNPTRNSRIVVGRVVVFI